MYSTVKRIKYGLFVISKGISGQIFVALYLRIFESAFERDFGNANCWVLIYLVLYGWTCAMNLK